MTRSRGFSLIELMIAMTVGLILAGAIIEIFLATHQTYGKASGASAMSDDARFATDAIGRALRSTGFIGCTEATNVTSTALVQPPTSVLFDFGNLVSGYEAAGTGPGGATTLQTPPSFGSASSPVVGDASASDWSPALPTNFSMQTSSGVVASGLQGQAIKGSDILVVHSTLQGDQGQPPFPLTVATIAGGALINNFTVTVPSSSPGFSLSQFQLITGQIAVISDCSKATVFQVTGVDSSSNTVTHAANSTMSMGNSSSGFAINFNPGALLSVPLTSIYFLAPGADGDSALWRADTAQPVPSSAAAGTYGVIATELVPDVENMQILYGVDPAGTRAATSYVTADRVAGICPNANFNCVTTVTVALLVASPPGTSTKPTVAPSFQLPSNVAASSTTITAPRDTRQRAVYQVSVALRNGLP